MRSNINIILYKEERKELNLQTKKVRGEKYRRIHGSGAPGYA
jgi:hypothetical protein